MSRNSDVKKLSGEFFTPSPVVDFMVNKIFQQLYFRKKILDTNFEEFQKTLLAVKFCDPAVGTGNFIVGLLKFVWKNLQKYSDISREIQNGFLKSFVKKCLYGVEIKKSSLDFCKSRIIELYPQLELTDFKHLKIGNSLVDLDVYDTHHDEMVENLVPFSWNKSFSPGIKFDVILGNPPYFNLKKMILRDVKIRLLYEYLKKSQNWSNYFRASSDIYYYFIIRSLEYLSKNGLLVFILPNYWIENKYADKLREILLENQIIDIYNFGELNIFKDDGKWLNVSTCVLVLEKTSPYKKIIVTKDIPRNFFSKEDVKTNRFSIDSTDLNREKWILSPYIDKIKKIQQNEELQPLSSLASVAQGMSPGVKSIFVLDETTFLENSIEKEITVPFVTNKNIRKWKLEIKDKHRAILPYLIQDLSNYPNTQKYLIKNKKELVRGPDRKRLLGKEKIRWFDFSVYRNIDLFMKKEDRILCPYRSLHTRFSLDRESNFCATDIYAIFPRKSKDLYNLIGILNSSFLEFWFREVGKRKGKMFEFFSDPLRKIPIPTEEIRNSVSQDVKEIIKIIDKDSNNARKEINEIEQEVNQKVAKMYGIENSFLHKYLKRYKLT
jgi:hypothetical protein